MKICVYILTRPQTLNPADETIKKALQNHLNLTRVESVRLGRYFEFDVPDSRSPADWRECLTSAFKKPMPGFPNPITEVCRVEVAP